MALSLAACDQQARLRALDSSRSFIVQAPAGSGKTELLIQRFLTLLCDPRIERPEAVLAITFTRKAAGEMRQRVIEALKRARQLDPSAPPPSHERCTLELAGRVLRRNDTLGWRLIEHPGRLWIQTIDSLCLRLVGAMPWLSRMGAAPEPVDDAGAYYVEAARSTVALLDDGALPERHAEALTRLLAHLDNNVPSLVSLLADMLAHRDQWLRHVVGGPDPASLRRAAETSLRHVVADQLTQLSLEFPKEFLDATTRCLRFASENLLPEGCEDGIAACAGIDRLPGTSPNDLGQWQGLASLFLTRKGTRRVELNRRQGFPPTPEGRALKRECLDIVLGAGVESRLHAVRLLPDLTSGQPRWTVLHALVELLPVAAAQLRLVFQEHGQVDFTEIGLAARTALGGIEGPTSLAFAWDCRIRHLLVDEFQDTSQSQLELLTLLTADWQRGDGRTVFLVGDPMQSIYGFREAEVGLFLQARQNGLGPVRLEPIQLALNFRSDPGIVEWVNDGIGPAFPSAEDTLTGAVTYERSVPGVPSVADVGDESFAPAGACDGEATGVAVHPFFTSDPELEAETVRKIIRSERERRPGGTIAVLVRARSHLAAIVSRLRREGERFQAVDIDALGQKPVVQDLLSLTRALIDPADRIAWLAILRAPWCGLTLADLHTIASNAAGGAVWDRIEDANLCSELSPDGGKRLERIAGVLRDAIGRRATMPIRRWVEGVWRALGGPQCLERASDAEDARAFLDLLETSLGGADVGDMETFRKAVDGLFAKPDPEAPVGLQLMTIHRAKGLEFDTVILPGLGRRTEGDDANLLEWLETTDRDKRPRLLMAPIPETGTAGDELYSYLRRVKAVQRDNENTRLLYVAATRARRSLHLLGHVRVGRGSEGTTLRAPVRGSLLSKMWPSLELTFQGAFDPGRVVRISSHEPESPTNGVRRLAGDPVALPPSSPIPWQRLASAAEESGLGSLEKDRIQPRFDWAGELQRRVGRVVHKMLESLRADGASPWDVAGERISRALETEGFAPDRLMEARRRVEDALSRASTDPRGRWILSDHEEDAREYAVSGMIDGRVRHLVLDRTFVDDGVRWIIDYKMGVHQGSNTDMFLDNEQVRYRPQLEAYAEVMSRIDPRPIRLGLYFPLLNGWREWEYTPSVSVSETP